MEPLYEVIGLMANFHAGLIFLALGIILVLVDDFAPTDVPAHFGYFCFAASMFFTISATILSSALIALAAWVGFEILHAFFLSRHLANETESPVPSGGKTA